MNQIHVPRFLREIWLATILLVICLLSSGLACDDGSSVSSSWDFTKDIDRVQKQVDFRIIVPSYLPDNLSNPPNALSPAAKHWKPPSVLLMYEAGRCATEGLIEIYEWGYPVGHANQPDVVYETSLVCGIEVEQTEHTEGELCDGPVNHPGYVFWWNQNGVYFNAGIYHYDHDEAVKVVESVIQQGKATGSTPSPF